MAKSILLVVLAVLPTLLIAYLVYRNDKHKEPFRILISLFLFGILSALGVICISVLLESFIPVFSKDVAIMNVTELVLKVFIEIALIEELCKWLIIYIFGYKNIEFDETYDIIIYAIFVALGFATIENIMYVLRENTIGLAVQRALFSVPGHTAYAIFMSYYLCKAKINRYKGNKKEEKTNIILSIAIPTIIHGIFDFCLFADNEIYLIIFLAFTVVLFIMAFEKLRSLYKANASLFSIKRCCKNCSYKFYGIDCPNCGTRQD